MELLNKVNDKIITIRNEKVILDSDVAELYGVETKRINEAVKNNPDKFPAGYIIELDENDMDHLWSKISTTNISSMSRVNPKAFTEKSLYMLATILKSPTATATTISIVETFAQLRDLSNAIQVAVVEPTQENKQALAEKSSSLLSTLLSNDIHSTDSETSIELNLALLKVKHTVKRK